MTMLTDEIRNQLNQNELHFYFRQYSLGGYPVFPVGSDKKPLIKWKEGASTDYAQLCEWWERWPDAMIGMPTGIRSGIIVLDVDRKGDVDGFATLHDRGHTIPEGVFEVRTPSGGAHFYFAAMSIERIGNSAGLIGPGLDVRGEGGYIVLPPSRPSSAGPGYRFVQPPFVSDHGFDLVSGRPPFPYWAKDTITSNNGKTILARECAKVSNASAGHRNDTLNKAAYVVGQSIAAGEIFEPTGRARLEEAAMICGLPPYEFAATIRSGFDAGAKSQRNVPTNYAGAESPELPVISAAAFHGVEVPKREFLDSGKLAPMRNVTIIYGDGGTGKSLLALQLAAGAVHSGRWMGLDIRRGPVLYYGAEDDQNEVHIRLSEICAAGGFGFTELSQLHLTILAGEDAVLGSENAQRGISPTALFEALKRRLNEIRPVLLVLDNLADIFGGNEIIRTQARQFIGMLRGLAIQFNCAVLVLGHPSQSGLSSGAGTAGTTGWSNSARGRLYFRRVLSEDRNQDEPDPNRRILENMKSNYGAIGGQILMQWSNGVFVLLQDSVSQLDATTKADRAERIFMALLNRFVSEGRNVSPNRSSSYAPTVFANNAFSEGVTKREFQNAMERLFKARKIRTEKSGPKSRSTTIIVPANH